MGVPEQLFRWESFLSPQSHLPMAHCRTFAFSWAEKLHGVWPGMRSCRQNNSPPFAASWHPEAAQAMRPSVRPVEGAFSSRVKELDPATLPGRAEPVDRRKLPTSPHRGGCKPVNDQVLCRRAHIRTQETTYRLSPTGWMPGDEPPDRVETWRRKVGPDYAVSWRYDWVDRKKSNAERDALRRRFRAFRA